MARARGIALRTLLALQALYVVMALAFAGASWWHLRTTGVALTTAPPVVSIVAYAIYAACLLPGVFHADGPYRFAMAAAIPLLAGGGVFGNIMNYATTGTEGYQSFAAWAIALAINSFGLVWNIVAAVGAYRR